MKKKFFYSRLFFSWNQCGWIKCGKSEPFNQTSHTCVAYMSVRVRKHIFPCSVGNDTASHPPYLFSLHKVYKKHQYNISLPFHSGNKPNKCCEIIRMWDSNRQYTIVCWDACGYIKQSSNSENISVEHSFFVRQMSVKQKKEKKCEILLLLLLAFYISAFQSNYFYLSYLISR